VLRRQSHGQARPHAGSPNCYPSVHAALCGRGGCRATSASDASDGDGKHPEEISLRPPKERDEIAEGEQACEEPRLDRASDESVDDRVGLPKARARAREDDRQRS